MAAEFGTFTQAVDAIGRACLGDEWCHGWQSQNDTLSEHQPDVRTAPRRSRERRRGHRRGRRKAPTDAARRSFELGQRRAWAYPSWGGAPAGDDVATLGKLHGALRHLRDRLQRLELHAVRVVEDPGSDGRNTWTIPGPVEEAWEWDLLTLHDWYHMLWNDGLLPPRRFKHAQVRLRIEKTTIKKPNWWRYKSPPETMLEVRRILMTDQANGAVLEGTYADIMVKAGVSNGTAKKYRKDILGRPELQEFLDSVGGRVK